MMTRRRNIAVGLRNFQGEETKKIKEGFMDLVIYGAQGIALGAYRAIRSLASRRNIRCFLVSQTAGNSTVLGGLPVREAVAFAKNLTSEEKDDIEVLIATPENVMPEIEETLDSLGLYCHVRLDSLRWSEMMSQFFLKEGDFLPLSSLPVGCHSARIETYMAKFRGDRPLQQEFLYPSYIVPIQVGAALCKERVADILDCDGENISEKNVNYSELTALYWVWKNRLQEHPAVGDYIGLAHYRRLLSLREDDLLRLADNDVDVVLPYPMPYEPDIEEHHKRYLQDADWEALLTALEELQPEYAAAFPGILAQQYFYNYNILLARRDVLKDYCAWLFPILERVEELSIPKGWERADRYIGYMGETLETLYFMYNRERLHIAHAGCRLLT
jgi:hypothetical protein